MNGDERGHRLCHSCAGRNPVPLTAKDANQRGEVVHRSDKCERSAAISADVDFQLRTGQWQLTLAPTTANRSFDTDSRGIHTDFPWKSTGQRPGPPGVNHHPRSLVWRPRNSRPRNSLPGRVALRALARLLERSIRRAEARPSQRLPGDSPLLKLSCGAGVPESPQA